MSFGNAGYLHTSVTGKAATRFHAKEQPDGRILLISNELSPPLNSNTDIPITIARYLADGAPDATFGNGGTVVDFRIQQFSVSGVALESTGKIIVAGTTLSGFHSTNKIGLTRYNSDGSVDTSFGNRGMTITSFLSSGKSTTNQGSTALLLLPDGKTLVAGSTPKLISGQPVGGYTTLIRYNSDGNLDTSFGDSGRVVYDFGAIAQMALDSAGRIVALGMGGTGMSPFLVRILPNGTADASFGSGGVLAISTPFDSAYASFELLGDGSMLVSGTSFGSSGYNGGAIVKILADGTQDSSFGVNGIARTPADGYADSSTDIAVQSGKILATGKFYTAPNEIRPTVVRFNADGSLDTSFGAQGRSVVEDVLPSCWDESMSYNLCFQKALPLSSGRVLSVGNTHESSFYGLLSFRLWE